MQRGGKLAASLRVDPSTPGPYLPQQGGRPCTGFSTYDAPKGLIHLRSLWVSPVSGDCLKEPLCLSLTPKTFRSKESPIGFYPLGARDAR